MEWVEIVGIVLVLVVLMGLAGKFMAHAETSANLSQFANARRLLRGKRPAAWVQDGVRGELGDERDDGREKR